MRRSPPPPKRSAPLPGIAAETPFDLQTVRIASCGLRDAGAPFGDVALEVRVYDAAQWLTEVRHPAWEPWSGRRRPRPRPAPTATCKLEKDGAPVEAAAWQQSWRGLHAPSAPAWSGSTTSGRGCSTTTPRGSRSRPRRWSARPASPGAVGAPRRRRSRCAPKARSICSRSRSSCGSRASWSKGRPGRGSGSTARAGASCARPSPSSATRDRKGRT